MCDRIRIFKQTQGGKYKSSDFFVRRHGDELNLSAAVRDSILPHQFVDVDVEGTNLILRPTDNETSYKLSDGGHGQRKLCCRKLAHFINIDEGVRHLASVAENGDIIICCGGDVSCVASAKQG